MFKYKVFDIVFTALCVAFAVVLDFSIFKIKIGANGGSISFAMIPLLLMGLFMGPFKGFIGTGICYGLITCLIDGYGFQTYPFDYLIGFGVLAIVGFFRKQIFNEEKIKVLNFVFLIGVSAVCVFLRLLSSTISGMIFYEMNFVSSMSYNALYILPSGGIAITAIALLYYPLRKLYFRQNSKL